jgi:hypothetical protein
MGDSRSVSLIVDVTQLTNNTHMVGFSETVRLRTELTAGISQTAVGQFAPEVASDSEWGTGTKNFNWGLTQTDGPASVEADCTNENTAAT